MNLWINISLKLLAGITIISTILFLMPVQTNAATTRIMILFQGYKIKLVSGHIILKQSQVAASTGLAIVTGATHMCEYAGARGAASSCTVSGVNSGDGLLLTCGADNTSPLSFTDSAGTPATPVLFHGIGYEAISVVTNAAAGSHTITCNGAAFNSFIYVQEYSGMANSSAIGASSSAYNNFSPVTCAALTSTQTNSMTVGVLQIGPYTWGSITNNFVERQTGVLTFTSYALSIIDNVATLNGASGSSISTKQAYTGGSGSWDCLLAEIKHQ